MKRAILVTILAVILAGSMSIMSCTQTASPSPATSKAPATSSAPAPKTTTAAPATSAKPSGSPAASPAAKSDGPVYGGILRTGSSEDAPGYDPVRATTARIQAHVANVFSGLVRTDPMKEPVTVNSIVPDMAEKWDISPDGKTYTFYIRKGVKFHDGHPFTAEDVKYSLDHFRDPKVSAFASSVAPITSVDIVDDYTVKVTLKHSYSELLMFITPPYCSMLPAHLKDVDQKDPKFLTGTGPFKFKSRIPGKVTVYEKNPDYYIKGLPYLDGHEIYIMAAPGYVDAFLGGQLDTAGTIRNYLNTVEDVRRIKQHAPEAVIRMESDGGTRGILFNMQRKGPWQDVRVRQAMAMVMDYEGTVTAAVGGPELGYIGPTGLVDSAIKEALPKAEVLKILGIDKSMDERINKAKELLKQAGYEKGFSCGAICRETGLHKNPVIFAADIWKRTLNIDVKVEILSQAQLFDRQDKGVFDLVFATISPATGVSLIETLGYLTSDDFRNSGKWVSKEYDALFAQIVQEMVPQKRMEMARKIQTIFYAELPYIPFHATTSGTAWRPDLMTGWPAVKGVVTQPSASTFNSYDRIWIANTADAQRWTKTKR